MNICIVNGFFPPHVSGSARLAFLLSEELAQRGHNVVVVTSRIGETPETEKRGAMTIYRVRSLKYPKLELLHNADLYWNLLPQNVARIVGILRRHRVDVVQAFGQFQDLTLVAVAACKVLSIPAVLSIHVRMEHPRSLYNSVFVFGDKVLVRHLVAQRVKAVVALDKQMGDYIIERYNVANDSISFIPTAVDIARFDKCEGRSIRKRYGLEEREPVILSLGTISNYRSPTSLITALPSVLEEFPKSKLLLVGAVHSAKPARLVKDLGLTESVIFAGRVDYSIIPSYLGACDVEGHDLESGMGVGLASLEAMAAGRAVLSSAREDNFINLRLQSWKNIVLVRPGNVKDISNALIRLLSDEKLRESIGMNARVFVKEHFALETVSRSYERLYQEITGSHVR